MNVNKCIKKYVLEKDIRLMDGLILEKPKSYGEIECIPSRKKEKSGKKRKRKSDLDRNTPKLRDGIKIDLYIRVVEEAFIE